MLYESSRGLKATNAAEELLPVTLWKNLHKAFAILSQQSCKSILGHDQADVQANVDKLSFSAVDTIYVGLLWKVSVARPWSLQSHLVLKAEAFSRGARLVHDQRPRLLCCHPITTSKRPCTAAHYWDRMSTLSNGNCSVYQALTQFRKVNIL